VNDILLTGNDLTEIRRVKKYFPKLLFICHKERKYVLDILQHTGLTSSRPDKFPMEQYLKLTPDDIELLKDRILSQYIQAPHKPHWDAAIRVLKYIKQSSGQGLLLPSENNLTLTAYCDSYWGGCQTTQNSVFGYFSWFFYYLMEEKKTYQDHQWKQNTAGWPILV